MSQSKIGYSAVAQARSGPSQARHRASWIHALCGLAVALGGLGGCTKTDSWFDPSVVGYWEHTPTQVPILRRLHSIEGPEDEYSEVSEVTAADRLADADEYRIGPGDQLQIVLWDVPSPGQPTPFDRLVDHRGAVDLPQLGEVNVMNLTVEQARDAFAQRMAERNLVSHDALVSITVTNPQQRIFTFMGAVGAPGPHYIPKSDYRLLEAVADSGGIAETVREVLIIREVPVDGVPAGAPQTGTSPSGATNKPADNEHLIDVLDQITGDKPKEPAPAGGGSPGAFGDSSPALIVRQPATPPGETSQPAAEGGAASPAPRPDSGETNSWVFVNNQWMQVQNAPAPTSAEPPADGLPKPTVMLAQRVIRVPVPELLAGDPRYNIVVRPGDIIRVPNPSTGTIYVGGEINRPGAFSMAPGLTLMRVIDAAGGLSSIGMPERVDIIRMTGPDRQAMLRLDLRAINEGSQPDIYMKANDRINVGTTFWAYPLAVVRNGFRATYGFGFVLDRNFSDYVFAPGTPFF